MVVALSMMSCFGDTAYYTTYVIQPSEQLESGGDYTPLAGTKSYAFAGTTDDLTIESYEDALLGIATSTTTGEKIGPFAWSAPYGDSETDLFFILDREEVVLVVVDPASEIYAYSEYTVPINFDNVFVDIVFRTWKDSAHTASTWTFIVPETQEDDEEEVDEDTQTDEDDDSTDTDSDTDTDTDSDTDTDTQTDDESSE